MASTANFTTDTRELVCGDDECGFEGEMPVTIDCIEIVGECPRCGAEVIVEIADLRFND